jgi:REP-associated tyrosine transposase
MTSGKPPRLERVFQIYDPPLYFVTMCTAERRKILAKECVHHGFANYGKCGRDRGIAPGRYVIMPDHIHFFVCGSDDFDLGIWVRGLKRVVAAAVTGGTKMKAGCKDSAAVTAAATTVAAATKRVADVRSQPSTIWQRGFFDHIIRNSESYSAKWDYICENPVRAGLVPSTDEWPFQGEIVRIEHR